MAPSRRDPALDVIRGLCIISMVISHLADGSALFEATHRQVWVDGATGFVLLAGLVLGMVQRRARPPAGIRQLARRARLVWTAQVALVVLALLVAPWDRMSPLATPPADALGGWVSALWQAVTLRLNPVDVDILSLYVVLFGAAAIGVVLLRHGHWRALLVVSAGVYLAGASNPAWATLPRTAGGAGSHFNVASWQALFILALVIGWHWHAPRLQRFLADRRTLAWSAGVVVAGIVLYQVVERFGLLTSVPGLQAAVRRAFDNSTMGPGRILLGWCVFVVLYRALHSGRVGAMRAAFTTVCEPIGRHSLGSYVILTAVGLVLAAVAPYDPTGFVAMQWVVLVVAAAWWWAWYREQPPRRAAAPARPAPAPTAPNGPAPARPAPVPSAAARSSELVH